MSLVKSWPAFLLQFLSVQGAVMVLSALSGFILVRYLPKTEYAWITLANTLSASLMAFVEPVAGVGLNSLAAPHCSDRLRLSAVVSAASRLQGKLLLVGALVLTPWSLFLLSKNGASLSMALLLCGIVVLTVALPQSLTSLSSVVIRLRGDQRAIFRADLFLAAGRLICTTGAVFFRPIAAAGLLATGAALMAQSVLVRRQLAEHVDAGVSGKTEDTKALIQQWRHLVPVALFLSLQAQLGPWILSWREGVEHVADLGALLRFGVLLAAAGVFAQQILIPMLARDATREPMGRHLKLTGFVFILSSGVLLALCALFPKPLLWILGPQYAHLDRELLLIMAFFLLTWLTTVLAWLNAARGFTASTWLIIPATFATQAGLLWLLPLHSLSAVIVFLFVSLLPQLAVQVMLFLRGWHLLPD